MARKGRVEFAGAVYHVLDRGDRREAILGDDEDPGGARPAWPKTEAVLGELDWSEGIFRGADCRAFRGRLQARGLLGRVQLSTASFRRPNEQLSLFAD